MTLAGTRPILQDELQKYELHHRARIAIKPGITGMWQVSGRSDITDFEEVVRLDKQIADRQNFLPRGTKFVAIPDRDGRRVGSGGATLEVLRYLHEQEGSFDSLRVLVIHSGGDSKRVPQYSALGKLFSPVPHELPNWSGRACSEEGHQDPVHRHQCR